MGSRKLRGRVLTDQGFVAAEVTFDALVESIEPMADAVDGPLILPGLVDLHVHGGDGGDVMDGADGLRRACRFHAGQGTTALVATTWTAPLDRLEAALLGIREVMTSPEPLGAAVLGAHLEGPWLAPGMLGAQPAYARVPERWEVERLLELATVCTVTYAPEVEGAAALLDWLLASDVRPQIGHSVADYAVCAGALAAGAAGFTHLYNAMPPMHHRSGGPVAAALAHAQFAEIIADGIHVRPEALRVASRAIPYLYCVSDAVACAGLPDGAHTFGGQTVHKHGIEVRLPDGTLAGSAHTLADAFRTWVGLGDDPATAARRVSAWPAAYLGLTDRGRLYPGGRADIAVFDRNLELDAVFILGAPVAEREGQPR